MSNGAEAQTLVTLVEDMAGEIKQGLARPIYLCVAQESGAFSVKQVSFLTPAQLAELTHVSLRTVYGWVEKSQENDLKFYRPPGTRGVLFEINEVLEWIRNAV